MVMSLCGSIFLVSMASFLLLFLSWTYILLESGVLYCDHILKHQILDSDDEILLVVLKGLSDKFSKITGNEVSVISVRRKLQFSWMAVSILTSKYCVQAFAHLIQCFILHSFFSYLLVYRRCEAFHLQIAEIREIRSEY